MRLLLISFVIFKLIMLGLTAYAFAVLAGWAQVIDCTYPENEDEIRYCWEIGEIEEIDEEDFNDYE
jgi:hypothetical protein